MSKEQHTLTKRLDDLKFEIERSIQYCDYRIFFWQFLSKMAQFLEFITSSAAFILLFQNGTTMAHILIAITAVVSILVFILDATKNARHNMEKMSKFTKLFVKVPVVYDKVTEKQYEIWCTERYEIDNDGSTHIPCLSVICHNDICLRKGIDDDHPLSRFERTIGKYFPFPYRSRRT